MYTKREETKSCVLLCLEPHTFPVQRDRQETATHTVNLAFLRDTGHELHMALLYKGVCW